MPHSRETNLTLAMRLLLSQDLNVSKDSGVVFLALHKGYLLWKAVSGLVCLGITSNFRVRWSRYGRNLPPKSIGQNYRAFLPGSRVQRCRLSSLWRRQPTA